MEMLFNNKGRPRISCGVIVHHREENWQRLQRKSETNFSLILRSLNPFLFLARVDEKKIEAQKTRENKRIKFAQFDSEIYLM